MKRVLTIQDISCIGKCSITIALPVLSTMGVECAILPTTLLSCHTAFPTFTSYDLTDHMMAIVDTWKQQDIHFDAIYTGYLGSFKEIELVKQIIHLFQEDDPLIFIDPVMGDHGELYAGFNEEYVKENTTLCSLADIIVPNVTEAAYMTNMPYKSEYDVDYIRSMLDRVIEMGAKHAVITGVSLYPGKTGVYGFDGNSYFSYQNKHYDAIFYGTGDLFASTSVGALVQGYSMEEAFQLASDHSAHTIDVTMQDPNRAWYGVDFESTLCDLGNIKNKG